MATFPLSHGHVGPLETSISPRACFCFCARRGALIGTRLAHKRRGAEMKEKTWRERKLGFCRRRGPGFCATKDISTGACSWLGSLFVHKKTEHGSHTAQADALSSAFYVSLRKRKVHLSSCFLHAFYFLLFRTDARLCCSTKGKDN